MAQGDPDNPADAPGGTLPAWHPPSALTESREQPRAVEALSTGPAAAPVADAVDDASDPEATLAVGSVIGQRYVIEQHISSGGFGAVYRATDRQIRHHQVALKLLHRPSASEAEREAALRELMLIASVSHPSVVQFKDYGWHEGRLWFAMPWYRGQTLDRVLGGGVAMSRAEARPIFARIAQGLAAMHAVGIHHHDIKPENIFLAEIAGFPGGLPVLLDLGIATQRGENPKGLTVEYASPETAAAMLSSSERPVGAAADVFSLALVLRNALDPGLAAPVMTENVMPILHERATQLVALPSRRDLRYLAPSFRRWLSLEPDDRPSAAELADQLAVLTEPEERRQAHLRLLKRIVPIVVIAALLVTALALQLREQKTALSKTGKELELQRQAGEELRKKSESQLEELELQAQELGDERQQLKRALGIARKLNGQLTTSTRRAEQLGQKVEKITDERDRAVKDKQALSAERDDLLTTKQALSAVRTALTAERDRLRADGTRLEAERDRLTKQRDRLAEELARVGQKRDELDERLDAVTKERDKLEKRQSTQEDRYESAARERDEALARQGELEQQLATLKADKRKLDRQLSELEATQAQTRSGRERTSERKKPRANRAVAP